MLNHLRMSLFDRSIGSAADQMLQLFSSDAQRWAVVAATFVASALAILAAPWMLAAARRRRRVAAIRRGLPRAIDMFAICIASGLSRMESIDYVLGQLEPESDLALELSQLRRRAEGSSLRAAFHEMAARTRVPELRQLEILLAHSDRLGRQLAPSLLRSAERARHDEEQRHYFHATSPMGRFAMALAFCLLSTTLLAWAARHGEAGARLLGHARVIHPVAGTR